MVSVGQIKVMVSCISVRHTPFRVRLNGKELGVVKEFMYMRSTEMEVE